MDASTGWWIAAALAVAAELGTGTFYLLMLGLGLAAGGVAAQLGAGFTGQMLAAALVGSGAVGLWTLLQRRSSPRQADAAMGLDVGQTVQVGAWRDDGSATVRYRGADWAARWEPSAAEPCPPGPGRYAVVALHGNELRLGRPTHTAPFN